MTWLYRSCSGGMRKWPVYYPCHASFFSASFTALAVLRTSQSHLETEDSLCPIPLATQFKIASSVWMEVSLQEATPAISLQAMQAIKKEWEKSIAKALSIPFGRMAKTSLPARKDMITFNFKLFSVSYSSCLSANEAEARISSSDLRWWNTSVVEYFRGGILPGLQITLEGVATLD